jgi:hypothetical protein
MHVFTWSLPFIKKASSEVVFNREQISGSNAKDMVHLTAENLHDASPADT